jgi:hypothetical protein
MVMYFSLFLLILTVTSGVAANQFAGLKHTIHTTVVRDYLDYLVPVSKNVLIHELMGPTVGSDVNPYSLQITSRV